MIKRKRHWLMLAAACVAVLAGLWTVAGAEEEMWDEVDIEFHALASEAGYPDGPSLLGLGEGTFNEADPGYGAQLEAFPMAKAVYGALKENLSPEITKLTIDVASLGYGADKTVLGDNVFAAISAFIYDHPETQYCNLAGYDASVRNGVIDTVNVYIEQKEQSSERKQALDKAVASFLATFDRTASEVEQYRAIHDYIASITAYNHPAVSNSDNYPEAHTAYGALVDGEDVVCEGYAKAFKVLCDAADLPCMLIVGEGNQTGAFTGVSNHMWNCVRVGDDWYSVDVTWDDADDHRIEIYPDVGISFCRYTYFMNNIYFDSTDSACDHRSSGVIYYKEEYVNFARPTLTAGAAPGSEGLTPEHLFLKLDTGKFDQLESVVNGYIVNGFALSEIPEVEIMLTQDATASVPLNVPADRHYLLVGSGKGPITLTRSTNDGTDALLQVSGTLELKQVKLDGGTLDYDRPVLRMSGGTLQEGEGAEVVGFIRYSDYETTQRTFDAYFYYPTAGMEGPVYLIPAGGAATAGVKGYAAWYGADQKLIGLTDLGFGSFEANKMIELPRFDVPQGAVSCRYFMLNGNTLAPLSESLSLPAAG